MRKLTKQESENATYLANRDIEFSFLLPTATGLGKSIMDATIPLREFFLQNKIHDYDQQKQGQKHKVLIPAKIIADGFLHDCTASLYRPNTKKGDPRIWFSGLKKFVQPDSILAICVHESQLLALLLSQKSFSKLCPLHPDFSTLLNQLSHKIKNSFVFDELLLKLKQIHQMGFIPATCSGDTAIGRTLETALGIQMNSSQAPDYKGIELKSKRARSSTRKTLFAKVPDWEFSTLKSFREFLGDYGYEANGLRRLNCTVSSIRKNSQGLQLEMDFNRMLLLENGRTKKLLVWQIKTLQQKLAEKHKETFWVSAESRTKNGVEEFLFTQVEYTRQPRIPKFPELLDFGMITIDHLIKQRGNSVHERGPLFKINKIGHHLLFPLNTSLDLST